MEKENIVISLSIDKIIEGIYALSALRHHTGTTPVLLERSNAPALRRLLRDLCAQMLSGLAPWLISCSALQEETDTVILEFSALPCPAEVLLTLMEGMLSEEAIRTALGKSSCESAISAVSALFSQLTPSRLPRIKRA